MAENKKVIVKVKRQQSAGREAALGRIRADVASAHERHHRLRDIAERPITRDGKTTTPDHLRLELSGRNLWLLRDGYQWPRAHGLLRADRQSRSAHSARADDEISRRARSGRGSQRDV